MPIDENTRKVLEEIIDKMIAKIPGFAQHVRQAREALNVNDESDFVLGWIWGEINAAISMYYALNLDREARQEEMNEIFQIINKHAQKMRTAINE